MKDGALAGFEVREYRILVAALDLLGEGDAVVVGDSCVLDSLAVVKNSPTARALMRSGVPDSDFGQYRG